jgi:hypothetical protein
LRNTGDDDDDGAEAPCGSLVGGRGVEVEAAPEPAEEDDQEEDEDAIRSPGVGRERQTAGSPRGVRQLPVLCLLFCYQLALCQRLGFSVP